MQSSNQLQDMLHSINRKSYPAYKSLKGAYQFKKYVLSIDHVQGDPFASPSHVSVKISHREAGFPAEYYKDKLICPFQGFISRIALPIDGMKHVLQLI